MGLDHKDVFGHYFACPMTGCRCPELAAGALLEHFTLIASSAWSSLLLKLPISLDPQQMQRLSDQFLAGKNRILLALTNKTFFWSVPPWQSKR